MAMFVDFCDKIDKELHDLQDEFRASSITQAMEKAYELVIKQEIHSALTENPAIFDSWSVTDQGRVLKVKNILDWFYQFWLKSDFDICSAVIDSMRYAIENVALPEVHTDVFN